MALFGKNFPLSPLARPPDLADLTGDTAGGLVSPSSVTCRMVPSHAYFILQARGVDAIPELALSTSDRYVAVTPNGTLKYEPATHGTTRPNFT